MMTRRQAIKTAALASAAFATLPGAMAQTNPATSAAINSNEPFTLPPLPYAYDALEPHIDAETMHIHHDKHHAAYVANLNQAFLQKRFLKSIKRDFPLPEMWLEGCLQSLNSYAPENIRAIIRNNGGGHYNHTLFWQMMKPNGGGEPAGDFAKAIDAAFGNFSTFKEKLSDAALGQFGSGWAWLVIDREKKLSIVSTPNQDTPLTSNQTPLLGLDVWEHAYYLKHQNKRKDYITAWWNVVNWDFVAGRYYPAVS